MLATGDVHVVPLRAGLGDVSVPSKTYSSLAAGRPVVASIDPDTEIPRLLAACRRRHRRRRPTTSTPSSARSDALVDDPDRARGDGRVGPGVGRSREASPAAVGAAYDRLLRRRGR